MKRNASSRLLQVKAEACSDHDRASETASHSSKHRKVGASKDSPASGVKSEATHSVYSDDVGIELEQPRNCFGCWRNSVVGRCYMSPDAQIIWAQETGRGAWCRECYTIWRTVFRASVSQVVYEMQLEQDPKVRCDHWQYITALVTLRFESHHRITKEMLETRKASICLAVRMMGVPFCPFVVGPRGASLEEPNLCDHCNNAQPN